MLLNADMMKVFHQWIRECLPSKQSSNWQHWLSQASLYSWHIMMSSLHHDQQRIF